VSWWEPIAEAWKWYSANRADLTPIGAFLGGVVIAWAALRQAGIAARRHYAQTEADRQRRITESFSKAVEQLGSDKIETRLGGIYTLERISRESPSDYWTIMETLTAFVRERARWKEPDASASETLHEDKAPAAAAAQSNHEPATDIAAVLSVIVRRGDKSRDRQKTEFWHFDLRGSDLRGAFFMLADLEGADLRRAHLKETDLGAQIDRKIIHIDAKTILPQRLTRPADWPSAHTVESTMMLQQPSRCAFQKSIYLHRPNRLRKRVLFERRGRFSAGCRADQADFPECALCRFDI
jgi:hypothetical protein